MEHGSILIVDDNPQILSILADSLRPLGHTILCAAGGQAALALATSQPPDLVLLDVMMPGPDGFAVCQQIRAHPLLAQVPVILITALDDRESRVRGFEAGADEFVTKPFDLTELRARVSTILNLNRYRKLLKQQQRLAAERTRFVWAVEHSDDGILVLGPDDYASYANPRARQLLALDPAAPLDSPFIALAQARYTLVPPEAWSGWPATPAGNEAQRFLVRPEDYSSDERWLRVDLLPPSAGDDARVLRLRDVTDQISSQRDMWTFHAIIGHKLRTPLVSILGGLNILSGGAGTMDRTSIARIAEVALEGTRKLRAEIEDILHYLRPPAAVYGSDGPPVEELARLAEELAADLKIASPLVHAAPELAGVRLRITRQGLEVAMRELFENAVKFHPRRAPMLELELIRVDDQLRLTICDDGPGIPPEQLAHAWRPYYQIEHGFTGQVEGMGLGLALVARIVHAVGGHYELANRAACPGAAVVLTLPLLAPPEPAPADV